MTDLIKSLINVTPVSGEVLPESVDFDGTNDYLSRTSDFIGNVDGKTFTFSCFFYPSTDNTFKVIYHSGDETSYKVLVAVSNDKFIIVAKNSADAVILNIASDITTSKDTSYNAIVSLDLSDTGKRSIYINDVAASVTWSSYTNDSIDFTNTVHKIGARYATSLSPFKGRLSHVFLDYTYRDLSIESNRRIFSVPM